MTLFQTKHTEAFDYLGVLNAGLHWSSFDVSLGEARAKKAKLLVTTIWNFHPHIDEQGHRVIGENGIAKDIHDGTYWYRLKVPSAGISSRQHVAHYNKIHIAFDQMIPIIGFLKDVKSKRCSLDNLYDCVNLKMQLDKSVEWMQLVPHNEVGCETCSIEDSLNN